MGHRNKLSFKDWLGLTSKPNFKNAMWLGPIVAVILGLLALVFILAGLITLFDFLQAAMRAGPYSQDNDGSAIRNIGLVLAALIGAPFVIWRAILAAKQIDIADASLFNDKVNEAAKNLTSRREISRIVMTDGNETVIREIEDDLVARAAAIDRLEGLANEKPDTTPRIARMLATYIRGNFPAENLEITEDLATRVTPRMDKQKAIDTIGRVYRTAAEVDPSNWRLDLKGCDFDGVDFRNGYFRAADFGYSRFEASIFNLGNFEGCLFHRCLLNHGDFRRTNLRGARLDRITLNRPQPVPGGFVSSINLSDLTGATFIASDISALDHLGTPEVIAKTFATLETQISHAIRRQMLDANTHSRAHLCRGLLDTSSITDEDRERVRRLEETGFQHWSPYEAHDLSTGHNLEAFYDELGMRKWPFYI